MIFPSGEASVNRIICYSKGLAELGNEVTIISTNYGERIYNTLDGFKYKSLREHKGVESNKILGSMIVLYRLIREIINPNNKYERLILVSNSLLLIYPLFLLCKSKNLTFLIEKSEYPFVLRKKGIIGNLYKKFYISTTFKLFDGMIIMTNSLNEYFSDKVSKKCARIVVPMTVDVTRFSNISSIDNNFGEYIAYCGDVGGNKDGVENLINSFKIVCNKYSNINLVLIGDSKEKNALNKLKEYVDKNGIRNVIFTGRVERNLIPGLLVNSKILVLARPNNLQATGGFPTKLGEYLSTGKPTIVTKVGEIAFYLEDGKNAFLAEPDNNKDFADKICYVLDNYEEALRIALNGKLLTNTVFNYKFQSKIIHNFLLEFNRND